MQDRAKLLWGYNLELNRKIEANEKEYEENKAKDDTEIFNAVNTINKYSL